MQAIDAAGADIAGAAVADAIVRPHRQPGARALAQTAVAKAQAGTAVVVDLGDHVAVIAVAAEQVEPRRPVGGVAIADAQRRQRVARVGIDAGAGGRGGDRRGMAMGEGRLRQAPGDPRGTHLGLCRLALALAVDRCGALQAPSPDPRASVLRPWSTSTTLAKAIDTLMQPHATRRRAQRGQA